MIGVFDSGLGGVFCLYRLRRLLPRADLVCLCDQAHLPYGEKSPSCLAGYFDAALRTFVTLGASAVFVACGTVSATVLPTLRRPALPLFDVLTPAVRRAARLTKSGHVAVLATERTVAAGTFRTALKAAGVPRVSEIACPAFVPLVEAAVPLTHPMLLRAVDAALSPLCGGDADVLLLGCTHYAYLTRPIAGRFGGRVLDCGAEAARALAACLPDDRAAGDGRTQILSTGDPAALARRLSPLFGRAPVCERCPPL